MEERPIVQISHSAPEIDEAIEAIESIGDLNELETESKDTIVSAVNEVDEYAETVGGRVDEVAIRVPPAPSANGTYWLNVHIVDGEKTYSWDRGGSSGVDPEPITITANGEYTAPTGAAYTPVTVNVPNTYTDDDAYKVVVNRQLRSQREQLTATANGTYNSRLYLSVLVDIPNASGVDF